jgi:hypothetical protein
VTFEQLESKFATLGDATAAIDDVRVLPADWLGASESAFVGLDPQGRRHFLVPTTSGTQVRPDRRSVGIQVYGRVLIQDGVERTFVDIACLQPHLNHVFTIVTAEILRELGQRDESADISAARVLDRWRELLARPSSSTTLSESERVGLIAELCLLLELTTARADAVRAWAGPMKGRHDFVTQVLDVEVKASASRSARTVEVHSLEQLQAAAGVDLFLVFYRFEAIPVGGLTINSLITELLAAGCPSIELFDRLTTLGVRSDDLDNSDSVRLLDRAFYRVDDVFPRLLPGDIAGWPRSGIPFVRYGVDLAEAPAPLGTDEVADMQAAFAAGIPN